MATYTRIMLTLAVFGAIVLVIDTAASFAQQRYTPNQPTVSPYLNLFQNNRNGRFNKALPNYYTLVRPQLEQNELNQVQQQTIENQGNTIQQLQGNVQGLQQQQQNGKAVVTGHNSWF